MNDAKLNFLKIISKQLKIVIAGILIVGLQIILILSGNLSLLNWLTIVIEIIGRITADTAVSETKAGK